MDIVSTPTLRENFNILSTNVWKHVLLHLLEICNICVVRCDKFGIVDEKLIWSMVIWIK